MRFYVARVEADPATPGTRGPVGADAASQDWALVQLRPTSTTRAPTEPALLVMPDTAARLRGRDVIGDLGDTLATTSNAARNVLQSVLDGFAGGGSLPDGLNLDRLVVWFLSLFADDARVDRPNRLRPVLNEVGQSVWRIRCSGLVIAEAPVPQSVGAQFDDNFNRANEDLSEVSPASTKDWERDGGVTKWTVTSNQGRQAQLAGGFHHVRNKNDVGGSNMWCAVDAVDVNPVTGGFHGGPMCRVPAHATTPEQGYSLVVYANNPNGNHAGWRLQETTADSRTTIASANQNTPAATFWRGGGTAQRLLVEADGSTITGKVDGSQNTQSTDTVHSSGSRGGMVCWHQDAGQVFLVDNWSAANIVAAVVTQAGFRIRTDDGQTLNADAGWAAAKNTSVSLTPERRFRIRFELSSTGAKTDGYKLQYSRNSGAWTDVPNSTSHFASGAAIKDGNAVPSDQYADLAATTQVISSGAFVAGSGCETNTTASQSLTASSVTEHEFCVCLHKLTDVLGENPDGTTFDFRLVYDDGTALDTYTQTPRVTVAALDGLIGGTVPEQPSNAGPWADANGVLYILVEHAETNPGIAMMKSADDGVTWDRVDHANRPTTTDWEGVSGKVDDDGHTIHIALRTSDTLYYHNFRMASHATNPDTWGVKDENLGATGAKTNSSDSVDLVYRGGTDPIVISYHGASAVHVRTGSTGAWNTAQNIDTSTGTYTGVRGTRLSDNTVMLIYKKADATAELRFKTLSTADVLSPAQASAGTQITTNIQALGNNTQTHDFTDGVVHDDGGVEVVTVGWMTTSPNNQIATVEIRDGTVQSELVASDAEARDSDSGGQAGGGGEIFDIAGDPTDKKVYAYWCDNTDTTLLLSATSTDGAAWTTPATFEDLDTDGADGTTAWTYIRARRVTHSTNEVVAVITGSAEGGTGRARYFETVIRAAGAPVAVDFTPMTVAASMPTVTVTPTTEVDITAMTSTATMPALDVVPTTEVDVTAMTVASTMPTVTVTATTEVDFTAMTSTATMPALDVVPTTEVDFTSMTVAATMPVVNTSTQDVDFTPMTVASTMPALDVTATAEVDFTSMTSSSTMPALDVVPTTEVDVTSMTVASTMPVVTVTAQADVDITAMTVAASMPVVAVTATAEVDFTPMTVAPTMPVVNTSTTIEVDFTSMTVAATMPALDVVATTEVDATPMTIASAMPVVSVTATTEVDFTSMTSTASMPVVNTDVGAVVDFTSMTSAASMPVVTVTAQADVDITPMTVALVMPVFNVTGVGSWGWKETTQPPVGTVGWQKTGV